MKLSLAGAVLASLESGWITAQMQTVDGGRMDYIGHGWSEHRVSPSHPMDRRARIQVEHHADLGATPRSLYRGESTSSRSSISGRDPAIATSKSEDVTVACISSSTTKSATNGS